MCCKLISIRVSREKTDYSSCREGNRESEVKDKVVIYSIGKVVIIALLYYMMVSNELCWVDIS